VICWQTKISSDAALGLSDQVRDEFSNFVSAAEAVDDPYTAAIELALAALFATDTDEAARCVEIAQSRAAGLANPSLAVIMGMGEASALDAAGDRAASAAVLREARRHAEAAGPYPKAIIAWSIAVRAAAPGFGIEPGPAYRDALALLHDLKEWANLWFVVESLATWWARAGVTESAATVLGHLDRIGRGNSTIAHRRARAAELVDAHPDAARWRAEGAAMSRDELIAYCLANLTAAEGGS
jgi:hypothetical protein